VSVELEDFGAVSAFDKKSDASVEFVKGYNPLVSAMTWNDKPISGVALYSYADTMSGDFIKIENLTFSEDTVRFDVALGKDTIGVFDFSIYLGNDFVINSETFSPKVKNGGYFYSNNFDANTTTANYAAISSDAVLSDGDSLVSLELGYVGSSDIKDDFTNLYFERVNIGTDYKENVSVVQSQANSNSLGKFDDLNIASGDVEFHLEMETSSASKALSAYDAYLTQKIALLPESDSSLDGISFSREQILAADVNENGRVNSMDVFAILQEITKVENGLNPKWNFLIEGTDLSQVTRSNTSFEYENSLYLSAGDNFEFTGILLGDVDGSWSSDLL
jgi:hypothetical protein